MKATLALFIIFFCNNAPAATLYLYGEIHNTDACTEKRTALARSASEDRSFFFTENAFTLEWSDPWSEQVASNLIGTVPFSDRVRGLESPFSWSIGLYYHTQANFDRLKSSAFSKPALANDPRVSAERQADLSKARDWLNMLLSDSGICDNEPARSAFCTGIAYDGDIAYSYRGDALARFIQRSASQMLAKIGQSVQTRIKTIQQQIGVPAQVQDPKERDWVRAVPGKQNSPGETDYQIIWRNYVMEKNLDAALQSVDPLASQDVHVVLGAAHVRHFFETLKRDYPGLTGRYSLKVQFDCMRAELREHYQFASE